MRRILLFFLFSALYLAAQAQLTERYINHAPYTQATTMTAIGNHLYANVLLGTGPLQIDFYAHWLYKLDDQLNTIDSLDLYAACSADPNHGMYMHLIKNLDNNKLMLLATEYSDSACIRGETHVLLIDRDLNVEQVVNFHNDSCNFVLMDVLQKEDQFIIAGRRELCEPFTFIPVLFILDDSLNLVELKMYHHEFSNRSQFLAITEASSGIFLLLKTDVHANTAWVILDSLKSIAHAGSDFFEKNNTFWGVGPKLGFIDRPNSNPLLVCSPWFYNDTLSPPNRYDTYYMMGMAEMDTVQDSILSIDTHPYVGHEVNGVWDRWGGPLNHFGATKVDDRVVDSVRIAAQGQAIWYDDYWQQFPNDMYIYNYNALQKSMNWITVYNSGYTHNQNTSAVALPGNRTAVFFNEYNWHKYPFENISIHLMILDSEGNVISNEEQPEIQSVTVYPMPFEDEIRVSSIREDPSSYRYTLIDMHGRIVSEGRVDQDGYIHYPGLASGQYVLRLSGTREFTVPIVKK